MAFARFIALLSTIPIALALDCSSLTIPVDVDVDAAKINITIPTDQFAVSGIFQQLASITSNFSEDAIVGTQNIKTTYDIFGKLCVPTYFKNGTLEIATHGVGFNHAYWEEGGDNSSFNYAAKAVSEGHAIFYYDRLGNGNSSKPTDGVHEVQTAVEIEVAHGVAQHFRSNPPELTVGKVVGVGHSFGSVVTLGVTAKYPKDFDDVVLTGFALGSSVAQIVSVAAFSPTIASQANSAVYAGLPDSYYVVPSIAGFQTVFALYPFFNTDLFESGFKAQGTFTLGEFLTMSTVLKAPATQFTGRVLDVTGAEDIAFCDGDCTQIVNGTTLPELAQTLYPAASNFTAYIPANTGHGINIHDSAPDVYSFIENWIGQ